MLIWFLMAIGFTFAQPVLPPAEVITIEATDGKRLVADFYPAPADNAPSIVLLHQLYTTRASWHDVIPYLHDAGYAVLTPDLRGYGQTGGAIDWRKAQTDTTLWIDWLRAHPQTNDNQLSLIGSSMGANLAVIGCADDITANPDNGCNTAIAISGGRNYFGYTPLAPALDTLESRPILLITAERDGYPALAAEELPTDAPGTVAVWWLEGNAHGMDVLTVGLVNDMLQWLQESQR